MHFRSIKTSAYINALPVYKYATIRIIFDLLNACSLRTFPWMYSMQTSRNDPFGMKIMEQIKLRAQK